MSKIKSNIRWILWIVLIIIIGSILLIPRKITNEGFEILRGFTSETIYRDTKDIVKYDARAKDAGFMDTIDDRTDELIMKRCYQYANVTIDDIIKKTNNGDIAIRPFTLITSNFAEVKNKIILDIETVHDTVVNGPIYGPMYALIFQVPYYKNAQGQDISLQSFNVSTYNFQPAYDERNLNAQQPIYYYVQMIYSRYNSAWRLGQDDLFAKNSMSYLDKNNTSFEPQCFMVGAGNTDGPNKFAGCASSKASVNGMNTSTCLGPKQNNNLLQSDASDKKNTVSSYGILYTINTNADTIKRYFFTKDSIDLPTSWQYLQDINVPTRINSANDLECLSNDNKGCLWNKNISLNDANNTNKNWKPLACGQMHKNLYGSTGYENAAHWCAKGLKTLTT